MNFEVTRFDSNTIDAKVQPVESLESFPKLATLQAQGTPFEKKILASPSETLRTGTYNADDNTQITVTEVDLTQAVKDEDTHTYWPIIIRQNVLGDLFIDQDALKAEVSNLKAGISGGTSEVFFEVVGLLEGAAKGHRFLEWLGHDIDGIVKISLTLIGLLPTLVGNHIPIDVKLTDEGKIRLRKGEKLSLMALTRNEI
jgi:hypothetical protein